MKSDALNITTPTSLHTCFCPLSYFLEVELPGGHATAKVLADSVSSLDSTPRCARGPSPAPVLSLFLVVASRLGESGILLLL